MQLLEFNARLEECMSQFNAEKIVEQVTEAIREDNHDNVVDYVVGELDLDDWDGDLDNASKHVLGAYEEEMEVHIDDEMDDRISARIHSHIEEYFNHEVIARYSDEVESFKDNLKLKVRHYNLELAYCEMELLILVYSKEFSEPYYYFQAMWNSDPRFQEFVQHNYIAIVKLTENLLRDYKVESISVIPNIREIIDFEWGKMVSSQ